MSRILLVLLVLFAITIPAMCAEDTTPEEIARNRAEFAREVLNVDTKVVQAKLQEDTWIEHPYVLVATDGTETRVSAGKFATTAIGDSLRAHWH